jgi:RNA polymerase sigma factor FliA
VKRKQPLEEEAETQRDAEADDHWARLRIDPLDTTATEGLVRHYAPLMKMQLNMACAKLPTHIDRQELEAAAYEGLFMAVRSFSSDHGVPFRAYAHKRIWGAIVDRLRGLDNAPRAARRASRSLNEARNNFIQRSGRVPDHEELAREMGVDHDALRKMERHAQLSKPVSIDAMSSNSDDADARAAYRDNFSVAADNPLNKLAHDELKSLLVAGLKALPDRERAILALHYSEGIRFNEIAAAMEVTESRISQLHSRALERLKAFIKRSDTGDHDKWIPSDA